MGDDLRSGRLRRIVSAFGFLKPDRPSEALALIAICSTLIVGGAAALKPLESLFAGDPWRTRADRVCLRAGNEYLSVEGTPAQRMRRQVAITRAAQDALDEIGDSVPIASTLSYQSMLSDKLDILHLMERKLKLRRASGKRAADLDGRISGSLSYVYGPAAEQLGLSVCGQGSGMQ